MQDFVCKASGRFFAAHRNTPKALSSLMPYMHTDPIFDEHDLGLTVRSGDEHAAQAMAEFLQKDRIGIFATDRNNPNKPKALSNLSPYIHFGQLGMQRAALQAIEVKPKFRVRHSLPKM